ncbi:MAG: hypothetical protein GY888_10545, partial [Planctomycetaceae bacterium]|nr:hypothetical protein [Planctomycetaceae bacterium]
MVSAGFVLPLHAQTDSPSTNEPAAVLQREIDRLILELGDNQYANRVRAQAKLTELGLGAFDALHRAQDHDDIEIAMRARYLVRSMRIQWALPDDPPAVRKLLSGYGERSNAERKNRMENLSKLPENQGVVALCRLVRYEANEPLSKRAALLIMQQDPPKEAEKIDSVVQTLRKQVGKSRRTAANWMRAYAQTLVDPESAVATWDKLTRAE